MYVIEFVSILEQILLLDDEIVVFLLKVGILGLKVRLYRFLDLLLVEQAFDGKCNEE